MDNREMAQLAGEDAPCETWCRAQTGTAPGEDAPKEIARNDLGVDRIG
jgi:hypothetical protein